MADRLARTAAWAHNGLSTTTHRLATGHNTLVAAMNEASVWWPARPGPAAGDKPATDEKATTAKEKPADDEEETEEEPATEKTSTKKTSGKPTKNGQKAKEKAAGKAQETKKKAPPVHTTYRPGPRRALAAAFHWIADSSGATDFLLRAGLIAAALGALAYFTHPYLDALHPAALCTIAAILVVYEITPRLAAILTIGLTTALISPAWLGITIVIFFTIGVTPVLAAILVAGLAAAAIHPALMWPVALAWLTAAWRAGAPEEETAEQDIHDEEEPEPARDWGTELLWHVIRALATAESAGRAGLHLDTILDSAITAGLLAEDIDPPAFRSWVEACGLPTADKVGMRIGGKPVTRVGMKMAAVTEALGMAPTTLIQARSQTSPASLPAAPARPADEDAPEEATATPAETPTEAPAPAALQLIS